jgi:hypothetical protein
LIRLIDEPPLIWVIRRGEIVVEVELERSIKRAVRPIRAVREGAQRGERCPRELSVMKISPAVLSTVN